MVEDDLLWKATFSGRGPSVEDKLWWKTTFGGRRPSVRKWVSETSLRRLKNGFARQVSDG